MIHKLVGRIIYPFITFQFVFGTVQNSTHHLGNIAYASYSREGSQNRQSRPSSTTRKKPTPRILRNPNIVPSKPKPPTYPANQNFKFKPASEGSMRVHVSVNKALDPTDIELSTGRRIRLIGVEVPESMTHNASALLESLCAGKKVSLEYTQPRKDSDGVRFAYVYSADDVLVNAELLRHGYGHVSEELDFSRVEEFKAYEDEAKEAGLGLWSE